MNSFLVMVDRHDDKRFNQFEPLRLCAEKNEALLIAGEESDRGYPVAIFEFVNGVPHELDGHWEPIVHNGLDAFGPGVDFVWVDEK
jgi:hypothetical protein